MNEPVPLNTSEEEALKLPPQAIEAEQSLLGSLMLFESRSPEFRLAWSVLLPTIILISGFFVGVAALVFRAHTNKPRTGTRGLVDEVGVVKKDLEPEGKVLVHGELWHARSPEPLPAGTKVRVAGVDSLVLEVEPLKAPEEK